MTHIGEKERRKRTAKEVKRRVLREIDARIAQLELESDESTTSEESWNMAPDLVLRLIIAKYADQLEDIDPGAPHAALEYIKQLEQEVGVDGLTGAFNRREMQRQLQRKFYSYKRARRFETTTEGTSHVVPYSVLVVDIDHFKEVNAQGTHLGGDRTLQQLVSILQGDTVSSGSLRMSDTVFRFGGEEFVVLMPHTTPQDAAEVAKRLRDTIQRVLLNKVKEQQEMGNLSEITVSIGVAAVSDDDETPDGVFQRADKALYEAKKNRNEVATYKTSMGIAAPIVISDDGRSVRDILKQTDPHVPTPLDDGATLLSHMRKSSDPLHKERVRFTGPLPHLDPVEALQYILSLLQTQASDELPAGIDENDVRQYQQSIDRMGALSRTDELTRLPNKRSFTETATRVLEESARQHHGVAIMTFDIDKFKLINDTFGHVVGDVVLRAMGEVLTVLMRRDEVVARTGGEEFSVLVQTTNLKTIRLFAQRLQNKIQEEVIQNAVRLLNESRIDQSIIKQFMKQSVTVSMGIVISKTKNVQRGVRTVTVPVDSLDELQRKASVAVYLAKGDTPTHNALLNDTNSNHPNGTGRNRYVIYTSTTMESIAVPTGE